MLPSSVGRAVNVLTHPGLIERCLRRRRAPVLEALRSFVREREIDVCLVSDRALLFAVPALMRDVPVIIDWVDSFVLHGVRSPILRDPRRPLAMLRNARDLMAHLTQERYYTRRSSRSLVVSPVDKRCLDAIAGRPDATSVLLNGVDVPAAPAGVVKEPGRLIFTGNMNFPPNYEAAIWFIDKVLPLIWQRCPGARFVIAGRNPTPELLARAAERVSVLGSVEDMSVEIGRSALYVAPLVSGGGFKNKVLEAIASGTYLAATPMAVEFLPSAIREKLLVGASAGELAGHVMAVLENPARYDALLPTLQRMLRDEFTWSGRASELLELVSGLATRGPSARAG
jgi:glycosyltransferase involved in cell wall biosynthesis